MQVAYNPQANFPEDMQDWWLSSNLDFAWWQVWFERYQNFIFSFADKAQLDGASGLVIGGDWVTPALPGGKLPDGEPSGVPLDAEQRWREIVAEVRNRFDGTLFWALPTTEGQITPPPFIEDLDQVYLLWSLPLSENVDFTQDELHKTAANYLDEEVFLLDISLEMPISVAVSYPSAAGSIQGCIPTNGDGDQPDCLQPQLLEPPHADDPAIQNNLPAQAAAYAGLLQAVNERDWIDGFVSRGYYSPAKLQDKSASINGKPSQIVLREWFGKLLPAQ